MDAVLVQHVPVELEDDRLTNARLETLAVDYAKDLLSRDQVHAATATLRAKIADDDRC